MNYNLDEQQQDKFISSIEHLDYDNVVALFETGEVEITKMILCNLIEITDDPFSTNVEHAIRIKIFDYLLSKSALHKQDDYLTEKALKSNTNWHGNFDYLKILKKHGADNYTPFISLELPNPFDGTDNFWLESDTILYMLENGALPDEKTLDLALSSNQTEILSYLLFENQMQIPDELFEKYKDTHNETTELLKKVKFNQDLSKSLTPKQNLKQKMKI